MDCSSFRVFKHNSGLHRLVPVYNFQNDTLLEITCHGSNIKLLYTMFLWDVLHKGSFIGAYDFGNHPSSVAL